MMFGLQRKSSKEKSPQQTISQSSFKYSLNNFDDFVSVQDRPNRRCNEPFKSSQGEADPKRRLLQFDVQEFCDNFVEEVVKTLKDVNQTHKKSTSTRAPVAEPSLFISKKSKGKSETHVEELKDFSDSLPIYDEYDEEPIESLMICEKNCDLPSLEPEFVTDIEHAIVELTILKPEHPSSLVFSPQVLEEEPLDLPHQGQCLDTRISFDEDLDPIFDEDDEPGPVFDEEATNITSIAMERHLCFDPGTTPAPLSFELQAHCEQSDLLNSQPDMFVKISSLDVIRFGLEKFLKHSEGFDPFEKSLELDLKQTVFCVRKSFDSFVFKKNSFDLSSSKHELITDDLFPSSWASDDYLIKKMLEQKSFEIEIDFLFVLSIQERQVQPLRNESIDRAQQPEIWRSFVVQTGYLGDASDRGSGQNGYLNIQKVFCHESNFPGKPTHKGFTEAWNHLKIFTEKGVINFPNRRFSSPSIREDQTSKRDSGPKKKRPEPKPILNEPKDKHDQLDLDHARLDVDHARLDEDHARLDLHHARLENDHARLEKYHARLEKDHARLDLDHEVSHNDRDFSLLARLARTACTDDRADDLSTLFDPIMDFSFGHFSKARILKLSEDLGFVGTQLVRSERPAALAERPPM
ncbi:hypothetical protein YC2023_108169 [Brassica napus]